MKLLEFKVLEFRVEVKNKEQSEMSLGCALLKCEVRKQTLQTKRKRTDVP